MYDWVDPGSSGIPKKSSITRVLHELMHRLQVQTIALDPISRLLCAYIYRQIWKE